MCVMCLSMCRPSFDFSALSVLRLTSGKPFTNGGGEKRRRLCIETDSFDLKFQHEPISLLTNYQNAPGERSRGV